MNALALLAALILGASGGMPAEEVAVEPAAQVAEVETQEVLPECQSYEEEEAGGCTPPEDPTGVTIQFSTEEEATTMMPEWIPCWGDDAGTWSCWIEGAVGANAQG